MPDITFWLPGIHPVVVYTIVAFFAFGESAALLGFLVPGEVSLIFAGVLAGQGHLSLTVLLTVMPVAALVGDVCGWYIGHRWGTSVLETRFGRRALPPRHVGKITRFMARHGIWAVVIGRWVGVLRAGLPLLSGATGMRLVRFLPAAIAGSVSWALTCAIGGYYAAHSWRLLQQWLSTGAYVLAGTGALTLATLVLLRRRRRARTAASRAVTAQPETAGPALAGQHR